MLAVKLSVADSESPTHTFAHLEIGQGVDFSNCGAFSFRKLDFELLSLILLIGCRHLNLSFILEEFKCSDESSSTLQSTL